MGFISKIVNSDRDKNLESGRTGLRCKMEPKALSPLWLFLNMVAFRATYGRDGSSNKSQFFELNISGLAFFLIFHLYGYLEGHMTLDDFSWTDSFFKKEIHGRLLLWFSYLEDIIKKIINDMTTVFGTEKTAYFRIS